MDNLYRSRIRRQQKHVRTRAVLAFWFIIIFLASFFFWAGAGAISQVWHNFVKGMTPEKTVNILLLGVGGGTHDGPDLTDTMIFVHLDPKNNKVTLVSIPRDLWIPDLGGKVNSAYTIASDKKPGNGLAYTKSLIGTILNQPITYGVKLDFGGFVKAVNILGGLDINVANTFDDYQYPIDGSEDATCGMSDTQIASESAAVSNGTISDQEAFPCRYKHLHFDQGEQHMDGETALEYVRSRHAVGPEGSDFARSKRQEKVISALKTKLFSAGTLLNPVKIVDLVDTLQGSLETDITPGDYGSLISLAQDMKGAKITSAVLDNGDAETGRYGLLFNPPISSDYGYQYVLVPRVGSTDYSEIQEYVACQIKGENCTVGKNGIITPTPKVTGSINP